LNNNNPVLSAFRIANSKAVAGAYVDTTNKIIFCKTFFENGLVAGSFFSCIYNGQLRIHAVLNTETIAFDIEIFELIEKSMETTRLYEGVIWVRTTSKNLISSLGTKFYLTPDSEEFFYYSSEYIMRRSMFNKKFDNNTLTAKPYDETHIDMYLEVLSDSMSFFIPPEDFFLAKSNYLQEFQDYKDKNAFEAFWKDDELVGLYWINGIEVDTMGVSSKFQRSGYGAAILTRAIEVVFQQNSDAEYAMLYCVGWNTKAQNFYKKYSMELKAIHKVPYNEVNR